MAAILGGLTGPQQCHNPQHLPYQKVAVEGKIFSKCCNATKTQEGFHQPSSGHGGGMSLLV